MPRSAPRHAAAVLLCAVASVLWLWPLVRDIHGGIPGGGPGDNLAFIWNLWWTRFALHRADLSLFFTRFLFFPFGADLTLHTNTLGPALLASGIADPVAAQNILNGVHLFLNFAVTYVLAWRQTRHWTASLTAAGIFGCSPYVSAHLQGHFNLIAAWTLPLTAVAALAMRERPTAARGACLGVVLGGVAYVDYYLFVFAATLAALLFAPHVIAAVRVRTAPPRWTSAVTRAVVTVVILDTLVVLWIAATGGGELRVLGRLVSIRGVRNPLAAGWLAMLLLAGIRVLTRFRVRLDRVTLRQSLAPLVTAAVVVLAVVAPLAFHGFALWRTGAYVTQRYLWRSAPAGVDVASLLLGNPYSAVYGTLAARGYRALHVDLIEQIGWITPAAVVLTIAGVFGSDRRARSQWLLPLIVFGVWSLGPFLVAAGHATPLWLPATLVRWIPIANNARIPGRAIAIVYLSVAMLSAFGMARLAAGGRRRVVIGLAVLLVLDAVPAWPPLYALPRPALDATLRALPPGAVCELPFGLRDGFGETGAFDARSMFFQTIHEHEIAGGFVARLPANMRDRYRSLPVLGMFLRMSGAGAPSPDDRAIPREIALAQLSTLGIRYIVVDEDRLPRALAGYVRELLPGPPLVRDGARSLYAIDGAAR